MQHPLAQQALEGAASSPSAMGWGAGCAAEAGAAGWCGQSKKENMGGKVNWGGGSGPCWLPCLCGPG